MLVKYSKTYNLLFSVMFSPRQSRVWIPLMSSDKFHHIGFYENYSKLIAMAHRPVLFATSRPLDFATSETKLFAFCQIKYQRNIKSRAICILPHQGLINCALPHQGVRHVTVPHLQISYCSLFRIKDWLSALCHIKDLAAFFTFPHWGLSHYLWPIE